MRRESECASVGSDNKIQMIQCEHLNSKDLWEYNDNQLYNKRAEKCLTVKSIDGKSAAVLEACTGAPNQQWEFDPHKEDENEV